MMLFSTHMVLRSRKSVFITIDEVDQLILWADSEVKFFDLSFLLTRIFIFNRSYIFSYVFSYRF